MQADAYVEMANLQSRHWWFLARQKIISAQIRQLGLPLDAAILEVGCGPGGNLNMLSQFGRVHAIELDDYARSFAQSLGTKAIAIKGGKLPHDIKFEPGSFDLICLFDVLEHIDEDAESLRTLRTFLKPDGRLLITVPAYQWMWSIHDVRLHHKRRYTLDSLAQRIDIKNWRIQKQSYFNMFLFPLAVAARLKDRLFPTETVTGTGLPSPLINRLFQTVFGAEAGLLKAINLPFGVSIMMVLQAAG